jgi:acid stress-induced BolA-like protein IbaG/YrbA
LVTAVTLSATRRFLDEKKVKCESSIATTGLTHKIHIWRKLKVCATLNQPSKSIMLDPTADEVKNYIAQGLVCEHLQVEGDGRHFFATIVCTQFEGLARVARHQLVYQVLGDRMREQIHALSMKTLTPAEWSLAGQ